MREGRWDGVLRGDSDRVLIRLSDRSASTPRVLLPGSFNPVHSSHLQLARLAASRLGSAVDFELSVRNVEKPTLRAEDIEGRAEGLRQAAADDPALGHLWLTAAPTFVEKARLFPGVVFVVGLDTFHRVADPRFHGSESGHHAALAELAAQRARFLVFFRNIDKIDRWDDRSRYPARLADLAEFVPVTEYADEERMASRLIRAERQPRPERI